MQWFSGRQPSQQSAPRVQPPTSTRVILNVYDLGPSLEGVNMIGKVIGTGAFHAGVEVYGAEWSFSNCEDGPYRSGIFKLRPKGCVGHVYRESIDMGVAQMTPQDVHKLIQTLYQEWPGAGYDLLRRNCCHFSEHFCIRLGVGQIPSYITSLAGVGAMLHDGIRAARDAPQQLVGAAVDAADDALVGVVCAGSAVGHVWDKVFAPRPRVDAAPAAVEDAPRAPAAGFQLPGAAAPEIVAGAAARRGWTPNVGDQAEVYSATYGRWCPAKVLNVRADDMIEVMLWLPMEHTPGMNVATKWIPRGDAKLQPAAAAKEVLKLDKGDAVEVWSNSKQAWCPGFVHSTSQNAKILWLHFKLPGAEEWSEKQLPMGNQDVRRAIVCRDSLARGNADKPQWAPETAAAFEELNAAVKANNWQWIRQASERARLAGVPQEHLAKAHQHGERLCAKESLDWAAKLGDEELLEEVIAQARQSWVAERDITEARAVSAKVQAAMLRGSSSRKKASDKSRTSSEDSIILPVVGDWVEIWCDSASAWCSGRITMLMPDGGVKVAFKMPGAKRDEYSEKVVLKESLGELLRRPRAASSLQASLGCTLDGSQDDVAGSNLTWSPEETEAYTAVTRDYFPQPPGKSAAELTLVRVKAFLTGSGLPRVALKAVLAAVRPAEADQVTLSGRPADARARCTVGEFWAMLRLVGHCQAILASVHANLLVANPEALQRRMSEDLLFRPPNPLPRFREPREHFAQL